MHLTLPLCSMGWCFSPQSLYWYEPLQESLSANSSFCKQLWLLWSSSEIPLGKLTDRIGYKSTLVLYQIALLISRTCLLLAHVSCNYSLFILQAILEGTAASFSSGTQSGYIYIMFSKEHYAEKSAHVANYGTVGFFASTLAYAVLYTLIGIKGLLLATIAANLVAVFTSLKIPKETVQPRSETRQKKNIPYPQLFQQKKIWMLLMILAALNIGRILINFFYAEKLPLCGINETWLAAIIMGYSAIQLLSERILARTKPEHYNQMMALFFILSGIALGVLGLVNVPVWTIQAASLKAVKENKDTVDLAALKKGDSESPDEI